MKKVEKQRETGKGAKEGTPPSGRARRLPYEVRRRAVQLYLEEGIPTGQVAAELGVSDKSIWCWARQYQRMGEAGLRDGCS